MKHPTREEQRNLVRQWDTTGRELEALRRNTLRGMAYNWADVDALLAIGDLGDRPSRSTSGLVEMQHWFMKAAPPEKLEMIRKQMQLNRVSVC